MNPWLLAAAALLLCLIPCGIVIAKAPTMDRLVALALASGISALTLMLMAEGYGRSSYFDVALGVALLSFPSGLVFAHFLERWL